MLTSQLWDLGTTGIAELAGPDAGVELVAGFDQRDQAGRAAAELTHRLGPDRSGATVTVSPSTDSAWADAVPTAEVTLSGRTVELDVGRAFGHGRHPTTALALTLLADAIMELPAAAPRWRVLDFGTGTGVLALAALAAGAASVVAVDNDEQAISVAAANLARHRDLGPGTVELADRLPPTTQDGPGRLGGQTATARFDVIVANVLLPVHLAVADELAVRLADNGRLILTGVLDEQLDRLLASHPSWPERARRRIDGWSGVILGPAPLGGTTADAGA